MGIEQLGVLNNAHKWRRRSDEIRFGKSNRFLNPLAVREEKRDGGRWGVAQGCNCRPILESVALFLIAQRPEMALLVIEQELHFRSGRQYTNATNTAASEPIKPMAGRAETGSESSSLTSSQFA